MCVCVWRLYYCWVERSIAGYSIWSCQYWAEHVAGSSILGHWVQQLGLSVLGGAHCWGEHFGQHFVGRTFHCWVYHFRTRLLGRTPLCLVKRLRLAFVGQSIWFLGLWGYHYKVDTLKLPAPEHPGRPLLVRSTHHPAPYIQINSTSSANLNIQTTFTPTVNICGISTIR